MDFGYVLGRGLVLVVDGFGVLRREVEELRFGVVKGNSFYGVYFW